MILYELAIFITHFPSVDVKLSTFQIVCWGNPLWYSWPCQPGKQQIVAMLDISATSTATFGSSMLPRVRNPWLIVGNGSTITSKPWYIYGQLGWMGAHDLLFQGALIQSSWLHIIWISPGRQYQLRGLNLYIRRPHTNGKKENVWIPKDGTKLTCPKILASSSPRSGIKVGWDGWIITYNVEIINCKSILHWTYPGEDLRQGRHLQSHVGSPTCAWPHKSLRHVYCTRLTHSSKPCGPIFFSPGSHQVPVGLKLGPVWVCHSERFQTCEEGDGWRFLRYYKLTHPAKEVCRRTFLCFGPVVVIRQDDHESLRGKLVAPLPCPGDQDHRDHCQHQSQFLPMPNFHLPPSKPSMS